MINEIDEYAIEEGLRLKEAHGGEVTILTIGPEQATESIRKALSMGADKAVHVSRRGAARLGCARDVGGAGQGARQRIEWDLVILGSESTDARMGSVCRRCSPSGSACRSCRTPAR